MATVNETKLTHRPSTIPWPNVWKRFETKTKNGVSYRVKIEDVTPDRFEEFIDFMEANFDPDEPLGRSLNILDDKEESMSTYRQIRRKILNENMSVVVVLDDDTPKPKILASHLTYVCSKGDSEKNQIYHIGAGGCDEGGAAMKAINTFLDHISDNIDEFALIGGDKCIKGYGLCVGKEYRGFNLGFHILSNLSNIARAFGINGGAIVFTSGHAQSAARKVGFKLCKEIPYNEYKDENGEIIFPDKEGGSAQYMIIKFPVNNTE